MIVDVKFFVEVNHVESKSGFAVDLLEVDVHAMNKIHRCVVLYV